MSRISDRGEWLRRAKLASVQLTQLTIEEFCNDAYRYHSVVDDIEILTMSLRFDIAALRAFLDKYPQTKGWLPLKPTDLDAMSAEEIQLRIQTNAGDERWVDGALIEPFEAGTLKAAIDRLIADFDKLELETP